MKADRCRFARAAGVRPAWPPGRALPAPVPRRGRAVPGALPGEGDLRADGLPELRWVGARLAGRGGLGSAGEPVGDRAWVAGDARGAGVELVDDGGQRPV